MSPNYRVLVQFDPERSVYLARVPELEHCSGEGATRAEALARAEEELSAWLENVRAQGGTPPPPVDDTAAAGPAELTVAVSCGLARELAWQARLDGVEVGQLVSELLPQALEARRHGGARRPGGQAGQPGRGPNPDSRRHGGPDPAGRGRYQEIMEDRAAFVEYVRGLEGSGQGQGQGRGRPPGGGRGRSGR